MEDAKQQQMEDATQPQELADSSQSMVMNHAVGWGD
jgi:hypothetical protein